MDTDRPVDPVLLEREQVLAKVYLFDGLTREALLLVADLCQEESHKASVCLFKRGEIGEKLYVLVEGKVRVSRGMGNSTEEVLAIFGPGEVFGEQALLDNMNRSADAYVHEDARLFVITREDFDDLLFMYKDLAYEILWNVVRIFSSRLRAMDDKLSLFAAANKLETHV